MNLWLLFAQATAVLALTVSMFGLAYIAVITVILTFITSPRKKVSDDRIG